MSKLISPSSANIRAASWWSDMHDLQWPSPRTDDRIARRADDLAAAGVNLAVQFGFHFRWDYLPVMERVHGYLRQVREELAERDIAFADHHSSVLVHRVRDTADRAEIQRRNAHHVPYYLDAEYAEELRFNGQSLNDWLMLSTRDGQPHYNEAYNNRQFCINNPDFQKAYGLYLTRLLNDTGISWLMSDDAIFYAGWETCSCHHCREKFRSIYGVEQPGDLWRLKEEWELLGQSEHYRQAVAFRLRCTEDFIAHVRQTIGPDVMLTSCCSTYNGPIGASGSGMSAAAFARHGDFLMQEICSPDERLLQWPDISVDCALFASLAAGRNIPYLPLFYMHCRDMAVLARGVSLFWGQNAWFSTLKGRMNLTDEDAALLPEEASMWREIAAWEDAHPEAFVGEALPRLGLYFNEASRDFAAAWEVSRRVCRELVDAGLQFRMVTCQELLDGPAKNGIETLLLLKTECMSDEELASVRAMAALPGRRVIALGPAGKRTESGLPADRRELLPADRITLLPADARLDNYRGFLPPEDVRVEIDDPSWRWRVKRTDDGLTIIFLAVGARKEYYEGITNAFTGSPVVSSLKYDHAPQTKMHLQCALPLEKAILHSPDMERTRHGIITDGDRVSFDLDGLESFFVVTLAFTD